MAMMATLRFLKKDKFGNYVFICSKSESYEKLKIYYNNINKMNLGTYNPIYYNTEKEYISMTFNRLNISNTNYIPNAIYEITYMIKIQDHDNKRYINCYITNAKKIKDAPSIEDIGGEDLVF